MYICNDKNYGVLILRNETELDDSFTYDSGVVRGPLPECWFLFAGGHYHLSLPYEFSEVAVK